MRTAIALFALLTACSTNYDCEHCCNDQAEQIVYRYYDTTEDGLPDSRQRGEHRQETFVFHLEGDDSTAVFVDTDDDGLPDARVRSTRRNEGKRNADLERALNNLERAIAEVRRSMR